MRHFSMSCVVRRDHTPRTQWRYKQRQNSRELQLEVLLNSYRFCFLLIAFPFTGTGDFKVGANYALGLLSQKQAASLGYDQILWLHGPKHYLTEVRSMSVSCDNQGLLSEFSRQEQ